MKQQRVNVTKVSAVMYDGIPSGSPISSPLCAAWFAMFSTWAGIITTSEASSATSMLTKNTRNSMPQWLKPRP